MFSVTHKSEKRRPLLGGEIRKDKALGGSHLYEGCGNKKKKVAELFKVLHWVSGRNECPTLNAHSNTNTNQ